MGRPAVLKVEIVGDSKSAEAAGARTESAMGRIGSAAGKVGSLAKSGAAAAVVAIGAIAISAGKSASDLQQSQGAVETVFGRSADAVKRYAASADKDLGLSKSAYENLASVVGAQLQNMGFSTAQSVTQTQALISKGADLAATYGGSVQEAVEALSSTLKGETDPIERYAVSINETAINAQLAAKGQDKLTGAAANNAKAQATLDLITKQTSKTTGAFGRESDTAAGVTARFQAQTENLKSSIGAKLLPTYTSFIGFLSTKALPAVEAGAKSFQTRFAPQIQAVSGFVTGALIPALGKIRDWIMGTVVPAIQNFLSPVLNAAKTAFGYVKKAIDDNRPALDTLGGAIVKATGVLKPLGTLLGNIAGVALKALGKALGLIITGIAKLVGWIDTAVGKLGALKDKASAVASAVGGVVGKLNPFSGPPLTTDAGVSALVSPGFGPGGPLTTAGAGDTFLGALLGAAGGRGAAVIVDRRTFDLPDITVNGALDPVAVARQLRQLLDRYSITLGQAPAYGSIS
jgi:hypothetical protein